MSKKSRTILYTEWLYTEMDITAWTYGTYHYTRNLVFFFRIASRKGNKKHTQELERKKNLFGVKKM